ncbi:MAG: transposase [Bacteroidales bacterium]|nr:transposase [Bacteroidales bacterium]
MKKEFYRRALPHFQQPGQAYFVTWSLKDAVPKKAVKDYSEKLEKLRLQIKSFEAMGAADSNPLINKMCNPIPDSYRSEPSELSKLKKQYYSFRKKYMKAFDDLLHAQKNPSVNLTQKENLEKMKEALHFWNGKKIENYAYTIMPNHVHWVFGVFEKDENNDPVWLQDILHSVKRFSGNKINKLENRTGALWQKESFDTTIRNEKHLYSAIKYTLNNPVSAGLVKDWRDWPGCWCSGKLIGDF